MMLGTRICQLNRFLAPGPTLDFFGDYNVTYSSGVPTIWQGIRSAVTADPSLGSKLKSLKQLTCGGSAPPPEMMKFFKDHHDVEFIQGWGMTEVRHEGGAKWNGWLVVAVTMLVLWVAFCDLLRRSFDT